MLPLAGVLSFYLVMLGLMTLVMVREMRRSPESGFFQPVLRGFLPMGLMALFFLADSGRRNAPDEAALRESLMKQLSQAEQSVKPDQRPTEAELKQLAEGFAAAMVLVYRFGPSLMSLFWLTVLSFVALFVRRRLVKQGEAAPAPKLRFWRSPDWMVWLLWLPLALLLLEPRGWLGRVEPELLDGAANLALLFAGVYLFQGMMVAFERLLRFGFSRRLAGGCLVALFVMAAWPALRGPLAAMLIIGLLDIWMDFRSLEPKHEEDERSSS